MEETGPGLLYVSRDVQGFKVTDWRPGLGSGGRSHVEDCVFQSS